jgi:hypothetical protein
MSLNVGFADRPPSGSSSGAGCAAAAPIELIRAKSKEMRIAHHKPKDHGVGK